MSDCIFCMIIKGEVDGAKVYEDADTLAFLDVNPNTKGHCLVIPKKHCENIFDVDHETLKKTAVSSQLVAKKIKELLDPKGVNLVNNSGRAAGQMIGHFHMHVIPRYENDGFQVVHEFPKPSMEELKKLAKKLSQ